MEALVWRRRRESSPAARKGRAAARGLDARRCLQNASCQRWTLHLRCQAYQNHLDIDHGIYRGVFLSEKGRALADRVRVRHRLVVDLLRALGVPTEAAEADAEGIEHYVSETTLKAFAEFLNVRR